MLLIGVKMCILGEYNQNYAEIHHKPIKYDPGFENIVPKTCSGFYNNS